MSKQQVFVFFGWANLMKPPFWPQKKRTRNAPCASLAPARVAACCATLAAASTEAWSWDTKMELDINPLDISH